MVTERLLGCWRRRWCGCGYFSSFEDLCLENEIIFEENEPDDGEVEDEDNGEDGCQQDGATVTGHRLHHIQKSLFSIDDIEKLDEENSFCDVLEHESILITYQNWEEERMHEKSHDTKD